MRLPHGHRSHLLITIRDRKDPVGLRGLHNAEAFRSAIAGCNSREEMVAMILECKHVWDYISGYLDDSLSPETKESVERHLEHCEICSAILDSTRNIIILTADDRIFELPVGFSERLHARLAEEMNGDSKKTDEG
jgi:anti-sigma factor RsiW